MLKSFKFILRNYKRKDGGEFAKATCKGQFLPFATAETEVNYNIHFTKSALSPLPSKEGIYEVSYEEGGAWIDTRALEKHIVRVNAVRVVYSKPLPTKQVETEAK